MKIDGFGGVKFWMQRVAEEHSRLAKKEIDRVGILFFQIYNFDKMKDLVQDEVVNHLLEDIKELFGEEEYNRILKEYELKGDKK